MTLYGALSALATRVSSCVVTEKLAMVSPCSVALCHNFASLKVKNAKIQKMAREANRRAEFEEMEEKWRQKKLKSRPNRKQYDYTNPPIAGRKTTKKVDYEKRPSFVDIEDVCGDDSTKQPESHSATEKVEYQTQSPLLDVEDVCDDDITRQPQTAKASYRRVKNHIYNNLYPWTNATELAEHLVNTKIYEDKHYLVLNKPVGVLQGPPLKTAGARCYGPPPPMTYSMLDAIPIIKRITGTHELKICYAPEKWNSGVAVLAKHSAAKHIAMYDCRAGANAQGTSNRQFWALTRYAPRPAVQARKRVGCMLENFEDDRVPVLVKKASNTKNKRNDVSAFYVDHTTLASSLDTGAALVQCGVTSTKRFALRVWLSHCLAPVLGDHLMQARVTELMGMPVPVPYSRATGKQNLSFELLQRLQLSPAQQELLPLFIHLRTVKLCNYRGMVEKVRKERRDWYPDGDDPYYDDHFAVSEETSHEDDGGDGGLEERRNGEERLQRDGRSVVHSGEDLMQSDDEGGLGCKYDSRNNERLNRKEDGVANQGLVEGSDDLTFTAPLPEHFLWTMERLGIPLETDDDFGY